MTQLVVEFDWVRDPKGYRLVETKKGRWVVRNGKGHSPKDFVNYRPLSKTDLLFKIFASTAITPTGVLKFVQDFGPLTWGGWDPNRGDSVELVISNARHMHQVLSCWDTNRRRPSSPLAQPPSATLDAMVIWDPVKKALKWELRPNTFLDALWVQLAQKLTSNIGIRQCEHCGAWFEAGQGTDRRRDSKFCSDEHRISFNSLKRSGR